jgi:hypothetical protein
MDDGLYHLFTTFILQGRWLCYYGNLYIDCLDRDVFYGTAWYDAANEYLGGGSTPSDELMPDDAVPLGTTVFDGSYEYPNTELGISWSEYAGKEVYADPNDSSVLFLLYPNGVSPEVNDGVRVEIFLLYEFPEGGMPFSADPQSDDAKIKNIILDYFNHQYGALSQLTEEALDEAAKRQSELCVQDFTGKNETIMKMIAAHRKDQVSDLTFNTFSFDLSYKYIEIKTDRAVADLLLKEQINFNADPAVLSEAVLAYKVFLIKQNDQWLISDIEHKDDFWNMYEKFRSETMSDNEIIYRFLAELGSTQQGIVYDPASWPGFTEDEIAEARAVVEEYFRAVAAKDDEAILKTLTPIRDSPNAVLYGEETRTLLTIEYRDDDSMRESYVRHGRGSINGINPENCIVFRVSFNIEYPEGAASVWELGKYSGWSMILIRDGKDSPWLIDDQGY